MSENGGSVLTDEKTKTGSNENLSGTTKNSLKKSFRNLISDPAWQSASVVIAIALFAIGTSITLGQRETKSVRVQLTELSTLIDPSVRASEGLSITYHGKAVSSLSTISLRVISTGNRAIREEDYSSQGFKLSFPHPARIITAYVVSRLPETLPLSYAVSERDIKFDPVILNPNEEFTIKCVLMDLTPSASVKPFIYNLHMADVFTIYDDLSRPENGKIVLPEALIPIIIALSIIVGLVLAYFVKKVRTIRFRGVTALGMNSDSDGGQND